MKMVAESRRSMMKFLRPVKSQTHPNTCYLPTDSPAYTPDIGNLDKSDHSCGEVRKVPIDMH